MKDPRRLLDGDGSDEQRALLRAGALEEPAQDGHARLLAALGLTAPAGGEAPREAPVAGEGGAASSVLTAGGSALSVTKLIVLALGSVALVGAAALLWARGEEAAGEDARTATSTSTSTSTSALPRAEQTTHHAGPAGSVALEIDALERVRSQLGQKDGQAALTALRRYSSEHPHGVLAHEAEVLRVEALWLQGEAAAALQLAEQLLLRHGASPHRARLQALARQARAASSP
jgi:hypothetical protein